MTDKLDISDAIMILENEKPHCGEKMIFTEEHKCEAYDMAIQALKTVGNTDRLAEWLKECREATPEERESVDKYVESISTPTGVTFDGDKKVSIGVLEQVMWERDVAIDQLKELGYELGQKIEKLTDGDYISRQDAILQIQRYGVGCFDSDEFSPEQAERFVINLINELPSVSQAKTGHWIKKPYLEPLPMDCLPPNSEDYDEETHSIKSYKIVCDKCGWRKDWLLFYKFCPNCGSYNGG